MKYSVLSLDFWQNTAIYMGKSYPCGTIGCDALNISPGIINQLIIPCNMLCAFMGPLMTGYGNPALLPAAREGAMQITRLLKNVKPFSYVDLPDVEERIARIFSDASLANANAYYEAIRSNTIESVDDPKYEAGLKLIRVAPVLAQLSFSLGQYQNTMLAFAEKLDSPDCKRTPEGYAELFGECFPLTDRLDEGNVWMAKANTTVQYTSVVRPGNMALTLVKRMNYVSFVGMFRSDLYEGLCVGHAPKKCRTCGRWFLTTNARPTKYCNGYAPGDKRHRTCRQIGNLKGRKERELAEDHPWNILYKRVAEAVDKRRQRKKIDPALARMMKKLAKDKLQRATSDSRYANGEYKQEMELSALEAEALAHL